MENILKYCEWYRNTNIYDIPNRLEKDNVPIKYSDLFKSLCFDNVDQELLDGLVQLERACRFFIDNGTESIDIYKKRLKKIQKRIQDY